MIETIVEEGRDRIVIKLNPGGPVELTDLTGSFAALARIYERHYRPEDDEGRSPKLYVTRLESGSVVAEIVPYVMILGTAIYTMDGAVIVADFTRRLWAAIQAFAHPHNPPQIVDGPPPSRDDAADIRAFVRPLTGKPGASLAIRHARLEKEDGDRRVVVEYDFDENEINRAAVNIDEALASDELLEYTPVDEEQPSLNGILTEVMLFFEQASKKPGKERGRTGDRGIIPDVTDKALPVYFRKSFQNLKDQMVRGEINPLTHAFVVDVHVQRIDGKPKGYIVTDVHQVMPIDEAEAD